MAKVAGVFFKQQNWNEAIDQFEQILAYLERNKYEVAQYQLLRGVNLRSLIIAKYTAGYKEEVIAQAEQFLKNAPEDSVIQSIVDGSFETNKTKEMVNFLNKLELTNVKTLLVVSELDENVCLASRNLGNIKIVLPEEVNTYDVVNADKMVLTEEALKKLEEVLTNE